MIIVSYPLLLIGLALAASSAGDAQSRHNLFDKAAITANQESEISAEAELDDVNYMSNSRPYSKFSDGYPGQGYGFSVDIRGGFILIGTGCPGCNYIGTGCPGCMTGDRNNACYVYQKTLTGWEQVSELLPLDSSPEDRFGWNVAVGSMLAVVGAPGDNDKGLSAGAAYVYTRTYSGEWDQRYKLTASDGGLLGHFGYRVALVTFFVFHDWTNVYNVNWVIVANPGNKAAYVYERKSSTSRFSEVKLTASDGSPWDNFGESVAISESGFAVVGAFNDMFSSNVSRGAVYVFQRQLSLEEWVEVAKLRASDGAVRDRFGFDVAVFGSIIVVGAPYENNEDGAVYIYEQQSSGEWVEVAKLKASGSHFGKSVSISANTILVGAAGAAYVYEKLSGEWTQVEKIFAPGDPYGSTFGGSVALNGNDILVGAYEDDAAYLFGPNPTSAPSFSAVPSTSSQPSESLHLKDMGVGGCQDSNGNYYSHVLYMSPPYTRVEDGKNWCTQVEMVKLVGVQISHGDYGTWNSLYCLYDSLEGISENAYNPVAAATSSRSGSGNIAKTDGFNYFRCYRHENYIISSAPSSSPSSNPSSTPSASASPSLEPTMTITPSLTASPTLAPSIEPTIMASTQTIACDAPFLMAVMESSATEKWRVQVLLTLTK